MNLGRYSDMQEVGRGHASLRQIASVDTCKSLVKVETDQSDHAKVMSSEYQSHFRATFYLTRDLEFTVLRGWAPWLCALTLSRQFTVLRGWAPWLCALTLSRQFTVLRGWAPWLCALALSI